MYYSEQDLKSFGLGGLGNSVFIKKTVKFYNPKNIYFGNNIIIDDFVIFSSMEKIILKNNIHISAYCAFFGKYGITMDDYSGLASRVALYSESDDYSGNSMTNETVPLLFKPEYKTGPINIGKHCIIGTGSTVMPDINIGDGAAVGAHSFVTKNLKPWTIYFGAPARKINTRSRKLLDIELEYSKFQK